MFVISESSGDGDFLAEKWPNSWFCQCESSLLPNATKFPSYFITD